MVHLDRGVIKAGPFVYPVQPDAPMAEIAPHARAHLRSALIWPEVAERVMLGLAGRIPVTHDPATLRIVHHHLPDWKLPEPAHTRQLAELALPGLTSYDLDEVSEAAGFDLLSRHSYGAAAEAHAVALLLPTLLRRAPTAAGPRTIGHGHTARHRARRGRTHPRHGL